MPAGVFNLVNGDGPTVGAALSSHPDVDMVSFTGSTRAGIEVARNAAPTVKRVAQELGGKSANIILDDVDFAAVVARDVGRCASTRASRATPEPACWCRHDRMDEAAAIAGAAADKIAVGDPERRGHRHRPGRVRGCSSTRSSGSSRPASTRAPRSSPVAPAVPTGSTAGFYVKPTVFANVTNDMTIAREEIFGPVLSIIGYDDEDDAVRIANDTVYGLAGYVSSTDADRARAVARRMRSGNVHLNGAGTDSNATVRRLQAVGQRPRVRQARAHGVPRGQGDPRLPRQGVVTRGPDTGGSARGLPTTIDDNDSWQIGEETRFASDLSALERLGAAFEFGHVGHPVVPRVARSLGADQLDELR